MQKVIKKGKVAVCISPQFGSGWYTENSKYEEFLFHPSIIEMVNSGRGEEINEEWLRENIETLRDVDYLCTFGNRDLTIQWIPVGAKFLVHEYDGSESIWTEKDFDLIA